MNAQPRARGHGALGRRAAIAPPWPVARWSWQRGRQAISVQMQAPFRQVCSEVHALPQEPPLLVLKAPRLTQSPEAHVSPRLHVPLPQQAHFSEPAGQAEELSLTPRRIAMDSIRIRIVAER
jgi:hypothetical protein